MYHSWYGKRENCMQSFGTEEYGNKDGFSLRCNKCGKEGKIVPMSYYSDEEYKHPNKITLELRCTCGNRFGATIHKNG